MGFNPGVTVITFNGETIPGGGSCIFSVNVTGTSTGMKTNVTGPVKSNEAGPGNQATAQITVNFPVPQASR